MGLRRVFIADLRQGRLPLPPEAAHHLTAVLRLGPGARIEAFNRTGEIADAELLFAANAWELDVGPLRRREHPAQTVAIASAVPKGDRADWLVEKLAELGVARWTPLRTARSVVHPEGESKRSRWARIAVEAARQSGAGGVLEIEPLTELDALLAQDPQGVVWVCSTGPGAVPAVEAPVPDLVLVGPEGGWSSEEEAQLAAAGTVRVTLGHSVLRVETAAVVAGALALMRGL